MCGILGFVTTEDFKGSSDRRAFMEQGLVIDMVRGEDSAGVLYGYQMGAKAGFVKDGCDGLTFVNSPNYMNVMKDASKMKFAVGHNRAATLGSITTENAHPFLVPIEGQKGHAVVGLHNGTVRGDLDYLPINLKESGQGVDSCCIMQNLAHVEPEDAMKSVIEKIDGAYMLVWHDSRDGTLNFARNDTRSFHMAQSYSQDTLFFASESGELQWLGERNGLMFNDVYYLQAGKHLKFTTEGGLEPVVREFTPAPKYKAPTKTGGKHTGTYRAPGSKTPGKPSNSLSPVYGNGGSSDNKVLLGGLRRAVPKKLKDTLAKWNLAVEDRLAFTPIQAQDIGQRKHAQTKYVVGYLDSLEMTCILPRVQNWTAEHRMDTRWMVRPVGVKMTGPESGIVVAEFVASAHWEERRTALPTSAKDSTTDCPLTPRSGVKGPGGSSISATTWMVLTGKGCVSCKEAVNLNQADDCRWTIENVPQVQCPACAAADDEALALMDKWNADGTTGYIH